MANAFKVGDEVMLKVGGPAMAVSKVLAGSPLNGTGTTYRCQWFAGKKLDSGDFPPESLVVAPQKVDPATPGN